MIPQYILKLIAVSAIPTIVSELSNTYNTIFNNEESPEVIESQYDFIMKACKQPIKENYTDAELREHLHTFLKINKHEADLANHFLDQLNQGK